jgi:integrase
MPGSPIGRRTLRPVGKPRVRGNGEGTVYPVPGRRRPWAASIIVAWTPEGRPIRRARYASSEREAKALLVEMIAANTTSRPLPDDRLTVGKWLNTWLRRQRERDDLRPNTVEAYDRSIRLLLPELGGIPLRRLRSAQVAAALADLRRSYTAHTVAGTRSVLSTAIKDAMRDGHVLTNEAALARAPKVRRRGLPAPDIATVRAILTALEGHRLRALYVLLAGTGLRIGEATGLRWVEDIRADSLTVNVQLQRIAGEHVLTDPKTDAASRVVFLPPAVAEALRSHKARQAEERLAAGKRWRKTGLVFTTTAGGPVAETTAHWVLAEACKRAGVTRISPHSLRRFYATTVTDAAGRDVAQRLLGHTTETMTERYVSVTDTARQLASAALEEVLA